MSCPGAEGVPVQVVPQGIASVNGSAEDMGCTSPLTVTTGVTICGSRENGVSSYLVDGVSPDIDTSTSDWASQLVTVRKVDSATAIPFPHVLLTFGFDTAVTLTGIEIDLLLCPDWDIGAPLISVYLNEEDSLVFSSGLPVVVKEPTQTSCDSLSTVTFQRKLSASPYRSFHILVDFLGDPSIEWVFVGEIRVSGTPSGGPDSTSVFTSNIHELTYITSTIHSGSIIRMATALVTSPRYLKTATPTGGHDEKIHSFTTSCKGVFLP